mgnify:FL=1
MATEIVAKLKQKLTTNEGELCHITNVIVTNPKYDDSLIIKRRVLTERRDFYLDHGYELLRVCGDKVLVQTYFSIKIKTFISVSNWIYDFYEQIRDNCDKRSDCCGFNK